MARCREISELLRSLDPLASPCQQHRVVNWSEIITSSLPSFSVELSGEEPLAGKQGTPSRIQALLQSLNDLLVDPVCLSAGTSESRPCQVKLSQTSLRLMCPFVNHGGQSISHSATSFFQNLGIQNSLKAPMVDFICIFENIEADYILENNILTVILHLCK